MELQLLDFDIETGDERGISVRDGREYFVWPARDGDIPVTVLIERYAVRLRLDTQDHPSTEQMPERLDEYRAILLRHRAPIEAAARQKYRPGQAELVLLANGLEADRITTHARPQDHCGPAQQIGVGSGEVCLRCRSAAPPRSRA